MRTVRFHQHGNPSEVLKLEEAAIPAPGAGHVAVQVKACGLNPADWALCRGNSTQTLPCGIGLDVSGIVTAIGAGVSDLSVGDAVFGPAAFMDYPTAGASDFAILSYWERLPEGLDHVNAAALPMVVETASRYLDWSGLKDGQTILINGAGTMVGFAAAQMAMLRSASVIATAGETFAATLRAMGIVVVPHGEGMVDRIQNIRSTAPDSILDAAPANLQSHANSALPDLVKIAGGDSTRVITVADAKGAKETGVRTGAENIRSEGGFKLRWNVLGEFGRRAAEGRFSIPVAQTFSLNDWQAALEVSLAGRARGKLVLLPGA